MDWVIEQEDAGLNFAQKLVMESLHILEIGRLGQLQFEAGDLSIENVRHEVILEVVHQEDHVLPGLRYSVLILSL